MVNHLCIHTIIDDSKNEHWTVSTDRHNESGKFNPAVHRFHKIHAVSLPGFTYPIVDARVKQVIKEMSDQFPFNRDYNSGSPLGVCAYYSYSELLPKTHNITVAWTQNTIKHGKRSSSFSSYLGPEFIGRPNLHVVLNAEATRLIQTSQASKEFKTVEFAQTV
jgi:choline dehydrogenase